MQIPVPFVQIPAALATDHTISTSAKAVFLALASHADYRTREAWPSIKRLTGQTGLSDETVSHAMLELESAGWISRSVRRAKNGRWNGYLYVVHMEACPPGKRDPEPLPTAPGFSRPGKKRDERESKTKNEKRHTDPPALVEIPAAPAPCVSPVAEKKHKIVYLVKRTPSPNIDQATLDAINRQLKESVEAGKVLNPAAYRRTLLSLAERGEYVVPSGTPAPTPATADFEATKRLLAGYDAERARISDEEHDSILFMLRRFNHKSQD